jgi:hypothetical protein
MAKQRFGNELHPLYARWLSTTQRCTNPKHASYKNYGARGISIAEDLKSFKDYSAFIESLPNYDPLSGTVDRIENNIGYVKSNLRWVSSSVQLANQRFSGKGSTTYTGVQWNSHHKRWVARINFEGKTLFSKVCMTEEAALAARNKYIVEHSLPHPVQPFK